jgi:hypothetical protein
MDERVQLRGERVAQGKPVRETLAMASPFEFYASMVVSAVGRAWQARM